MGGNCPTQGPHDRLASSCTRVAAERTGVGGERRSAQAARNKAASDGQPQGPGRTGQFLVDEADADCTWTGKGMDMAARLPWTGATFAVCSGCGNALDGRRAERPCLMETATTYTTATCCDCYHCDALEQPAMRGLAAYRHTHMLPYAHHTHTHTHTPLYICMCVCVHTRPHCASGGPPAQPCAGWACTSEAAEAL